MRPELSRMITYSGTATLDLRDSSNIWGSRRIPGIGKLPF